MKILGRMKVKTLKSNFSDNFGLTLRIYDGNSFADDNATVASIRKGENKGGEFTVRRNIKVGNLEDKIQENYGVKTQISGSDDSYLCDNNLTLAAALLVDAKKMERKEKKKSITVADSDGKSLELSSIEGVLREIKVLYSKDSEYEYMVSDLSEGTDFVHWGDYFLNHDENSNKELASTLFKLQLDKCEYFWDYVSLANAFAVSLQNKDAAIPIYKKALGLSEKVSDFLSVANAIANEEGLNDKVWAKELYTKVIELSTGNDTLLLEISFDLCNKLKDRDWAIEILKSIEINLLGLNELVKLIDVIVNSLKDTDWAINVTRRAIEKAIEVTSGEENHFAFDILELAKFIAKEDGGMNAKEAAEEVFELLLIKESEQIQITAMLEGARAVKELYSEDYFEEFSRKMLVIAIENVYEGFYTDIYFFIYDDLKDKAKAKAYKKRYLAEMEYDAITYSGESLTEMLDYRYEGELEEENPSEQRNIILFTVNCLTSDADELLGEGASLTPEAAKVMNEALSYNIEGLKLALESIVEEKVLIESNKKLQEYKPGCIDDTFYWEGVTFYMVITEKIPAETLDVIFLCLEEYEFTAVFENSTNDEYIKQSYEYGEYDTGYFSNDADEIYINGFEFTRSCYQEAKVLFNI